jgi:hypothetical protein
MLTCRLLVSEPMPATAAGLASWTERHVAGATFNDQPRGS